MAYRTGTLPELSVYNNHLAQNMRKKPGISEEEQALFRDAMRGVKPLPTPNKVAQPPLRPQRKAKQVLELKPPLAPLSDYETLEPVSVDTLIEFAKPGITHKVLRKLRRGQYNVEAILDLHGMTGEEAKESLYRFILECQERSMVHILIIHGKGRSASKPILKNKLNHWLRQLDAVLAFCSAAAKDGKSGAMYVLLKNQRGEIFT